jgi:hypothetical protein
MIAAQPASPVCYHRKATTKPLKGGFFVPEKFLSLRATPSLTIQQIIQCCFFVNGLTLCRNPAMLPDAVSGIYPTNCCLTGA